MKSRSASISGKAFLASGALLVPFVAQANAGTPLMWAGMLHLFVGNAFIGGFEGFLIGWIFKRPKIACVALMIAANYLSAWIGGVWIATWAAGELTWNLYNAWRQFWLLVVVTFGITLLLEWPFVAACFWKAPKWGRRSLAALLLTQSVSYLLLFGWYWGASGKSLYTRMHVVQASQIEVPTTLQFYYIGAEDGRIYKWSKPDKGRDPVGNLASTNLSDRLLFWPLHDGAVEANLCLRKDAWDQKDVVFEPVLDGDAQADNPRLSAILPEEEGRETDFNFGYALKLEGNEPSTWRVLTGYWPIEGMTAENEATGKSFHFCWETPFSQWSVRNATQIPDDKVLFQLGDDQICILDLETRQIACLARGHGPAVVPKAAN